MKTCSDCGLSKPLSSFHTSGRGYRANCRVCRADKDRRDKLKRHYNMTVGEYLAMYGKQDGRCSICRQPETMVDPVTGRVIALAVDHDHSCCAGLKSCGACVRSLLCSRCNVVLGLVNDNQSLLLDYIIYLRKNQ